MESCEYKCYPNKEDYNLKDEDEEDNLNTFNE